MRDDEIGDAGGVVKVEERHRETFKAGVAGNRDDMRIARLHEGPPEIGAMDLDARMRPGAKTLDKQKVGGRHAWKNVLHSHLVLRAIELVHQRPAAG